jgi:hypothetical protein
MRRKELVDVAQHAVHIPEVDALLGVETFAQRVRLAAFWEFDERPWLAFREARARVPVTPLDAPTHAWLEKVLEASAVRWGKDLDVETVNERKLPIPALRRCAALKETGKGFVDGHEILAIVLEAESTLVRRGILPSHPSTVSVRWESTPRALSSTLDGDRGVLSGEPGSGGMALMAMAHELGHVRFDAWWRASSLPACAEDTLGSEIAAFVYEEVLMESLVGADVLTPYLRCVDAINVLCARDELHEGRQEGGPSFDERALVVRPSYTQAKGYQLINGLASLARDHIRTHAAPKASRSRSAGEGLFDAICGLTPAAFREVV